MRTVSTQPNNMLTLVVCLVVVFVIPTCADNVELTSNKEGQFTCPGDQVTFTCRVFGSSALEWRSPLITLIASYISTDTPLQTLIRGPFTATLIDISGAGLNANFTSTLQVNLSKMMMRNETTVMCLNSASDNKTDNFTMAAIPSPPQNPSYTVQQYGQNSVTLTVQWQPPQYDGGAPVNYTITVSPGLSPVTTSGTSVPVTVPYDVTHAVSIVATNCNGSSSATMVTIRIVNCSDPASPGNGSIGPYQNTTEGAEIIFRCNPGFVPAESMTAVCGADRRWNPNPATLVCTCGCPFTACILDCGAPDAPQRGSLESYADTTEGSEVFYSCNTGLVPEGRMRAVCTRNGWSPNPVDLNCVVNCSDPTIPINGSIETYQITTEGAEIFFKCNPGFVPAGRMRAVCGADGRWNPDPATFVCTLSPIDCRVPSTLANGVTVLEPHTTTVSSVILYQCQQPGLVPSSNSSVCEEDGRWSPDPSRVVCVMIPVSCGRPITPDNGSIDTYQNTSEGAEIFFRCNPGSVPAGRMTAVCGADGSWNPDPASLGCTVSATVCGAPIFSSGASGVAVEPFGSTIVNSEIHYQCRPGFQPEERRTLLCGEDGRWNPDPLSLCTDTSLSTATAVAIAAIVCLLVAFIAGTLCGALVTVCISRWNKKGHSSTPVPNTQEQQQAAVVYEEVDAQSKKIELKENVAYGPVKPN